jgi:hypothetical protein
MGSDGWQCDVPFYIGFSLHWDAPIDVDEAETAAQAWQEVCNLERSDEVIRFIRAPDGRILTMRERKELAENESLKTRGESRRWLVN